MAKAQKCEMINLSHVPAENLFAETTEMQQWDYGEMVRLNVNDSNPAYSKQL